MKTFTYDELDNVLTETNELKLTTTYTCDAADNRTSLKDLLDNLTRLTTLTTLYRLTNETIANDPHGVNDSFGYDYDAVGKRVSKTVSGVTTNYLVDTNNHTAYAQVVLTSGAPVRAAGEADIVAGGGQYVMTQISNKSGHFEPLAASLDIGKLAFANAGVSPQGATAILEGIPPY